MKNKILYITHPSINFSTINKNSVLITNSSQDLSGLEYHTSLGDLQVKDILGLVENFSKVEFIDVGFSNRSDPIYDETIILLRYISNFVEVAGLEIEKEKTFVDILTERNESPVLWTFGCSHSYGVGLKSGERRFSEIVASELNLPLKLVAKPGSSLHWSLRQLIDADIRFGDVVIWQLTTAGRVSVFNGEQVDEVVLARSKDRYLVEVNTDSQIYFNQLTLLRFGVRYLRAKNIKFVMTSIESDPSPEFRREYTKYPEYCYAPGFQVDYGTDDMHGGPKSHENVAFAILKHLQYQDV